MHFILFYKEINLFFHFGLFLSEVDLFFDICSFYSFRIKL